MPPRNTARGLLSEDALARRVAYEREKRGWTYEGLAKRMTDVGCAINQSGLYKVEKGEPRRRIAVDELVAFSQVFQIPIDHLLLPPALAAKREMADLLIAWSEKEDAVADAQAEADTAMLRLRNYVAAQPVPDAEDQLDELLHVWARAKHPEGDDSRIAAAAARATLLLSKDPERRQSAATTLNAYLDDFNRDDDQEADRG